MHVLMDSAPVTGRVEKSGCFQQFICVCLIMVAVSFWQPSANAAEESAVQEEYVIKAFYLMNFCKYVSWPEESFETGDAPLMICILGRNPFGKGLAAFEEKNAKGHPFVVQFCDDVNAIPACHVLFVSKSMQDKWDDIIARTKSKPILTVGDMDGFAKHGGIINFFMHKDKIRFEINQKAAEAASVQISSQLLKLAKITNQ